MTEEPMDADGQPASDLLEGFVVGGPLDGGTMTSRRPAGVLLIDRPAGRVWRYAWRPPAFECLDGPTGRVLVDDPVAPDNRERAAEEGEWDVQAAPWIGSEPDLIDPDDDPEALGADAGDVDVPGELGDEVTGAVDESEV